MNKKRIWLVSISIFLWMGSVVNADFPPRNLEGKNRSSYMIEIVGKMEIYFVGVNGQKDNVILENEEELKKLVEMLKGYPSKLFLFREMKVSELDLKKSPQLYSSDLIFSLEKKKEDGEGMRVYAAGEFEKPGAYLIERGGNLALLALTAGGPNTSADKRSVYVIRANEIYVFSFDFKNHKELKLEVGDIVLFRATSYLY